MKSIFQNIGKLLAFRGEAQIISGSAAPTPKELTGNKYAPVQVHFSRGIREQVSILISEPGISG